MENLYKCEQELLLSLSIPPLKLFPFLIRQEGLDSPYLVPTVLLAWNLRFFAINSNPREKYFAIDEER